MDQNKQTNDTNMQEPSAAANAGERTIQQLTDDIARQMQGQQNSDNKLQKLMSQLGKPQATTQPPNQDQAQFQMLQLLMSNIQSQDKNLKQPGANILTQPASSIPDPGPSSHSDNAQQLTNQLMSLIQSNKPAFLFNDSVKSLNQKQVQNAALEQPAQKIGEPPMSVATNCQGEENAQNGQNGTKMSNVIDVIQALKNATSKSEAPQHNAQKAANESLQHAPLPGSVPNLAPQNAFMNQNENISCLTAGQHPAREQLFSLKQHIDILKQGQYKQLDSQSQPNSGIQGQKSSSNAKDCSGILDFKQILLNAKIIENKSKQDQNQNSIQIVGTNNLDQNMMQQIQQLKNRANQEQYMAQSAGTVPSSIMAPPSNGNSAAPLSEVKLDGAAAGSKDVDNFKIPYSKLNMVNQLVSNIQNTINDLNMKESKQANIPNINMPLANSIPSQDQMLAQIHALQQSLGQDGSAQSAHLQKALQNFQNSQQILSMDDFQRNPQDNVISMPNSNMSAPQLNILDIQNLIKTQQENKNKQNGTSNQVKEGQGQEAEPAMAAKSQDDDNQSRSEAKKDSNGAFGSPSDKKFSDETKQNNLPIYSGPEDYVDKRTTLKTQSYKNTPDMNSVLLRGSSAQAKVGSYDTCTYGKNMDEKSAPGILEAISQQVDITNNNNLGNPNPDFCLNGSNQLNEQSTNAFNNYLGFNNQNFNFLSNPGQQLIQKLQIFKDQQLQQQSSNLTQKLNSSDKQAKERTQMQVQTTLPIQFVNNRILKPQCGSALTNGTMTTATDSNLNSLMSSQQRTQQLQKSNIKQQEVAQERFNPGSIDLKVHVEQLVNYLSLLSAQGAMNPKLDARTLQQLQMLTASVSQPSPQKAAPTLVMESNNRSQVGMPQDPNQMNQLKQVQQQFPIIQQLIQKQNANSTAQLQQPQALIQNKNIQKQPQQMATQFNPILQSVPNGAAPEFKMPQPVMLNTSILNQKQMGAPLQSYNHNQIKGDSQNIMSQVQSIQPNSILQQNPTQSNQIQQLKQIVQIAPTGQQNTQILSQLLQQGFQPKAQEQLPQPQPAQPPQQTNNSQQVGSQESDLLNQVTSILSQLMNKNSINQQNVSNNQQPSQLLNQFAQLNQLNSLVPMGNGSPNQAMNNIPDQINQQLQNIVGVNGAPTANQPILQQFQQKGPQTEISILKDIVGAGDAAALQARGLGDQLQSMFYQQQQRPLDYNTYAANNGLDSIRDQQLKIDKASKRIKKEFPFNTYPVSEAPLGVGVSYRRNHEKIQDKGDYFLIHRLNSGTKRMNQILQCKKCPLKFPKLCNLRDHLRIHNDEMPFHCGLCKKSFTQAGNRDRHEKKRVCQKRNPMLPGQGSADGLSSNELSESGAFQQIYSQGANGPAAQSLKIVIDPTDQQMADESEFEDSQEDQGMLLDPIESNQNLQYSERDINGQQIMLELQQAENTASQPISRPEENQMI